MQGCGLCGDKITPAETAVEVKTKENGLIVEARSFHSRCFMDIVNCEADTEIGGVKRTDMLHGDLFKKGKGGEARIMTQSEP